MRCASKFLLLNKRNKKNLCPFYDRATLFVAKKKKIDQEGRRNGWINFSCREERQRRNLDFLPLCL